MKIRNVIIAALSVVTVSILVSCNGGSTETGNARSEITGSIVDNGSAVDSALVELVAEEFVPGASHDGKVFSTHTDSRGSYRFDNVPHGAYYLNAKRTGKRLLRGPIPIDAPQVLAADALKPVSRLNVTVPNGWIADEVFVKGVSQSWKVASGAALLDSLPSGEVTIVAFVRSVPVGSSPVKEKTMQLTVDALPAMVATASFDNAPPRIVSTQAELERVVGIADTTMFKVNAIDPEGLSVRYSLQAKPVGMSIDSISGIIAWNTDMVSAGDYSATVKVVDAGEAYCTVKLSITVAAATFPIAFRATVDTLAIDRMGSIGKSYLFAAAVQSSVNASAYRFDWGDGDTSLWQGAADAAHVWKSVGRYAVRFQVQYRADGSFSAWSDPLWINIGNTIDNVPPVITLIGGDTVIIPYGDPDNLLAFYSRQVAVVDNESGSIIPGIIENNVNIFVEGAYMIVYRAVDSAGNSATAVRYVFVNVVDTIPPILKLIGLDSILVPDSINIADFIKFYKDPGCTAWSNFDGDLSSKVKVGPITRLNSRVWYRTYDVTDSAGNRALTVKRIFVVSDTTTPVVGFPFGDTIFCADSIDAEEFFRLFGGILTSNAGKISIDSIAYRKISRFQGMIVCYGHDVSVRYLLLITGIPPGAFNPTLRLLGPVETALLVGDTQYIETGYTATDPADGDLTSDVNVDTAGFAKELKTPGVHYLFYWVTNSARSTVVATRIFVVQDGAVPSGTVTDTLYMWRLPFDTAYVDDPVYIDTLNGSIKTMNVVSGVINVNKPGTYTRIYSITDSAGMVDTVTRTVVVTLPPATSALHAKYGVPAGAPLSSMTGTFDLVSVDSDTNFGFAGRLAAFGMTWDSTTRRLGNLQITRISGIDTITVKIETKYHLLDTPQPALLLQMTGVANLDGAYFVKVNANMVYWVDFRGRVAFVWRKH